MTDEFDAGPARQPTVSKSAEHAPIRSVEVRADWRARKWARKRMATRCEEDRFPEVADAYRRGDRDEFLRDDIEAYLAGAAASADREEELEARVAELEAALKPLAALAEKIGTKPKDESCWCGQDGAVIRFGDIRRARALLKEGEQ